MDPLEKIKESERLAKEAIARGDWVVTINPQFTRQQLGLREVLADREGRLWVLNGSELVRIG